MNKKKRFDKESESPSLSWCVGRRPVQELLDHRPYRIKKLYIEDGSEGVSDLKLKAEAQNISYVFLHQEGFHELFTGLPDLNHQGVCAEITPSVSLSFAQLLERCNRSDNPILLALDQIQDPQNVGTIFRVGDCAGVAGIFFPERRSASVSPLVRKISAGATEFVPYSQVGNLANALKQSKEAGFWVYGTTLSSTSKNLYQTEINRPAVIVLGSEHYGLRSQTSALCDELIHIPQYGVVQSLNVATSASVVLFEMKRRENASQE